jgi:hypothetical protein
MAGAGQRRQLGRMVLFYDMHKTPRAFGILEKAINELLIGRPASQLLSFVVASSARNGIDTGAGMVCLVQGIAQKMHVAPTVSGLFLAEEDEQACATVADVLYSFVRLSVCQPSQ